MKKPTNQPIKLLVAEDETANYLLIEIILKEIIFDIFEGYDLEIRHANNGKEAIDKCLAETDIELVLMDMKMPMLDGISATEQIKQQQPNTYIIAMSGYAYHHFENHDKIKIFNDYLVKPIMEDDLKLKIEKFLALNQERLKK